MLDQLISTGTKATRDGFGQGLLEAGHRNANVVGLTADLLESLQMQHFQKEFPDRFFQVGIARANMIGIAAGLAIGGKIAFTGTFANFSTGRVYDQIRQSVAYSHKNVKICASHAGVTLGEDGATHQILEDVGMMPMLRHDRYQSLRLSSDLCRHGGYCRTCRPGVSALWPPGLADVTEGMKFEIGKALLLASGTDVTIFATGHLVWTSIEAAKELAAGRNQLRDHKYSHNQTFRRRSRTLSIRSLKPAPWWLPKSAQRIGGLGDAIANLLAHRLPTPMEYVGVDDQFGESGKPAELLEKYGMGKKDVIWAVKDVLERKH